MTKEEILQKSRGENAGRDIEDLEVQKTAAKVAYFASFGLCALVSAISWILTRKASAQVWIVFFGMLSVTFFVKFFKMKKLHELFVALGYLAIFAALIVAYIFELSGRFLGNEA
ncbi:MAG: hypothetical protein IJL24_02905 [Treponema sp.]|nr:hypothetical protein [Treponema sp.]